MTQNTQKTKPQEIYRKDYSAPSHLVENVDLTFQLHDGHTIVIQTSRYKRNGSQRGDLQLHHGHNVDLVDIKINDNPIHNYKLDDDFLTVPTTGDTFVLEITTKIYPEKNTALDGLYKSGGNFCTQCEAEGFRNITFWQDRPDVMSVFTVRVEADKDQYPVLLSNGNCVETGVLDGGRHFAIWHDPHRKPCYLFALVAGDLVHTQDSFTTASGRKVELKIYTREGELNQVDFAMQALKDSMKWDEEVYGREYDLDIFNIVAVGDFNMGAMENKSLNIFNTALVFATPELSTDEDFIRVLRVIGHEYFHNWSGNRVTCQDWFQLSLKEGFTVYRENQFGQAMGDPTCERIDEVTLLRDLQFAEDASPMAHPIRPEDYIEINNFYTMTVYEKGGEVIRMFNTLLGDDLYRKGTDLYFSRHDGQAATCDDFLNAMKDASANKYMDQFALWYSQAGTPNVKATHTYDLESKIVTVTFTQNIPNTPGQKNKKPMVIPIKTALFDKKGNEIAQSTLIVTQETQSFTFENIDAQPVISYLRGFSAPVILETQHSHDDRLFLLEKDTDGFNQWESGQQIFMDILINGVMDNVESLITTLSNVIDRLQGDKKLLLARILSLPGESTVANAMSPIDPALIETRKNTLKKAVATGLKGKLISLYSHCENKGPFDIHDESMGKRALRNLVLDYIQSIDESLAVKMAYDQYQTTNVMTERLGALAILSETDRPEREHALADFYDRYKSHDLVIDKWFSVQASSSRKDTPSKVRALMEHPDFTLSNPNRTRALIGAFAMRNQNRFHGVSGEGYKILSDIVIALNEKNPQIASRLLTPLRQWEDFTPDLQKLMKQELKRIMAVDNLSPNVFEIVSKCLNG